MVLLLGSALDLPLRERNVWLHAAGFAPAYGESSLEAGCEGPLRKIVERILAQQEPYPALALTARWDVVQLNEAAGRLLTRFLEPPLDPLVTRNVLHALFHPRGLRPFVVNWDEVSGSLLDRLQRELFMAPEPEPIRELIDALVAYPGGLPGREEPPLGTPPAVCIDVHLRKGPLELRLFTTLTTLGTPIDVAAQELRIESYFPIDEATSAWLRAQAQ